MKSLIIYIIKKKHERSTVNIFYEGNIITKALEIIIKKHNQSLISQYYS